MKVCHCYFIGNKQMLTSGDLDEYAIGSTPVCGSTAESFVKRELDVAAHAGWKDELDVGAHIDYNNKADGKAEV